MRVVRVAGEPLQVLERTPVLDQRRSPPVQEELASKEALLGVLIQLA